MLMLDAFVKVMVPRRRLQPLYLDMTERELIETADNLAGYRAKIGSEGDDVEGRGGGGGDGERALAQRIVARCSVSGSVTRASSN